MAKSNRTSDKNRWISENLDRINLTVLKGRKEIIQNHAQAHGESTNSFINRAIRETINRDQEKNARDQHIAQIAAKSGQSAEDAEHDMKVEEALALLERDVPGVQDFYAKMRMVRRMSGKI